MRQRISGLLGRLSASARPRRRAQLWAVVYASSVADRRSGLRGTQSSRSDDG